VGVAALALVVLFGVTGTAQAGHSDLSGQWHLDETCCSLLDTSGHSLTGTPAGGPVFGVPGRFGSAMRFPSESDYVNVGNRGELQPSTITLLAWVRSGSVPTQVKGVVSQGAAGNCAYSSYSLYTGGGLDAAGLRFYVHTGGGVTKVSPPASNSMWDGQWHLAAGTYDGATVRLFVDGQQVGSGTPASGPIGYGLGLNNDFIIGGAQDPACVEQTNFTGDVDEVRVYNRALSPDEIAYLARSDHTTPPNLPIPGSGSGGGGPTAPPRIDELRQLPSPAGSGRPALVLVDVSGGYDRLEWNLRGDEQPELISGPGQNALRFRLRTATALIGVRAVNAGGVSPLRTISVTRPKLLRGSRAQRISNIVTARPVDAAGPLGVLTVTRLPNFICASAQPVRVRALNVLDISGGCLRPISALADIPAAERGIVEQLARQYGIPLQAGAVGQAINLSDAYLATGEVTINGVKITPAAGASVVIFPQVNAIASSNARMSVGSLKLANPSRFIIDTRLQNGAIPFGNFGLAAGSARALAAFDLVGDVKVEAIPAPKVLRGARPSVPRARITTNLRLPPFLRIGGSDLRSQVVLEADTDRGLVLNSMRIGPLNADMGALAIQQFRLDYTGANEEWRGQGKACVPSGLCLDMIPPNGSVVIRNGRLNFAGASLQFPPPGVVLFPGLNMERIGFGVGLDPTRFTGNAKLVALQLYEIDGRLLLAFPSAATPYIFNRDEVGPNFPAHFYGRRHTTTTVALSADVAMRVPVVGSIRLGGGHFLYEFPGYVAFGGGVDQSFLGVVSMRGGVGGELNMSTGRFNVIGSVNGCLIGVLCRGATGLVSSRGLAVCLSVGPLNIGGGATYNPFGIRLWPLDGCKWSPFAERNVRGLRARASGAPGSHTVTIGPGDPSRAIELRGAEGPPRVRVTGPGGQSLDSPEGSGFVSSGALRIIRQESTKLTAVGLQDPRPGTYRIETMSGSPAVAGLAEAQDPPAARISARVLGTGTSRVLAYDILRRRAQRVTFTEIAGTTRRVIGTVNGGGRGRLRFTTAPGRGRRAIEAQFELDGLPAEKRVVSRFAPPAALLGRPGGLRVRRLGTALRVTWRSVAGATAYEVVVSPSGAAQRTRRTRSRRLLLRGVPRSSSGRVTVRAVAQLRQGRAASAGFRATAARAPRFKRLPRAPRLR
jgi:Concanavalin A-like lectin/glucanases superfamily